jgi:hypothetical protein
VQLFPAIADTSSPQQDEDGKHGSKAQKQTLLFELRIAQPWSDKKERVRIHFKIAEILMDSQKWTDTYNKSCSDAVSKCLYDNSYDYTLYYYNQYNSCK